MPTSDKTADAKAQTVISAWETLRAEKSFAGMTLTQFKNKVKPSFDARASIDSLQNQLTAAINARDDADQETTKTVSLVVNSVKGDPDEGEDGELYEAMGYIRKSERRSGLSRKAKAPPAARATA